MKKFSLIIILLITMAFFCNAHELNDTIPDKWPYGISLRMNSLLAGGLSLDVFVSPKINLELSGSVFLTAGFEGGVNYYLFNYKFGHLLLPSLL